MKNLRTELQEHRVNVVEGTSKPVDPNQKGRQNATRFCIFCRTNGHTPSWGRKKIRDEELKKNRKRKNCGKKSYLYTKNSAYLDGKQKKNHQITLPRGKIGFSLLMYWIEKNLNTGIEAPMK